MRSSISKIPLCLHDHQVSSTGVGARHMQVRTPTGGGGYLNDCTKLELSLTAKELHLVMDCMSLPVHWKKIADYLGAPLWLVLWRDLETLRVMRQLRIAIPHFHENIKNLDSDEFENWLDSKKLTNAFFCIYKNLNAEQYRFIWDVLFDVICKRSYCLIYVPSLSLWNIHLRNVLAVELMAQRSQTSCIRKQINHWTDMDLSINRLNVFYKQFENSNTSKSSLQCSNFSQ